MIGIGWIILIVVGGLLLLVLFLLCCSVIVHVEYNKDFSAKAKYLFVTLYDTDSPPKPKKKKKKKKKKKSKQKKSLPQRVAHESGIAQVADDVKKANKRSFDFEVYKLIYDCAKTPVKRLIKKLRVTNLRIDCIVGGDDAARVAMTYGLQSAAISGGLAWLNEILKLRVKRVNVTADFKSDQTSLHMKCKVKIRVITALVCIVQYFINSYKNK